MQGGWHGYMHATSEKPKITRVLLGRVLRYSKPYRWHLLGMLFMILLTSGLNLLTPLIMRDLIDRVIPGKDITRLMLLAAALLCIPAFNGGIGVIQRRVNSTVGEGVIFDLRVALFARLQRMSLSFFTNTKVGELMSRLNNDVNGAQNAITNTIVGIVTNLVQAVAVISVMLSLEWRLTLISVAILPLFIITARKMGGVLRQIARQQMSANAQMNAMMNETLNIGGALLVKLFGRTAQEVTRFEQRAGAVRALGIKRSVAGGSFFVIIGLVGAVGSALVYGFGGYFAIKGVFTVGMIVAFGAYLGSLYGTLQALTNAPVEFATSIVSFERVFEVIDLPLEIQNRIDPVRLPAVRGELVFENVTFRYGVDPRLLLKAVERHGSMDQVRSTMSDKAKEETAPVADPVRARSQARQTALENISFTAKPGQRVALVGPSGSGKTTLTYLIPRLYDPAQGRITIDGTDLRDFELDSLALHIGMVTQETYLFHDTIRTNLLYAKLDATSRELEEAAKAANIHQFIADMPDGYDTIVGERGYRLSGGEKQRLALARVILKDPRILLLDEATSHLDSESESLIQQALLRVMAGRTSIIIAHRLSTILTADQILVLDSGRIVERGTHQELIDAQGLYMQLYETQFKKEELTQVANTENPE